MGARPPRSKLIRKRRRSCAPRWRRLIVEQFESRTMLANHPPVAFDHSYAVAASDGSVVVSTGPGVSPYYATDADGDPLTLEIVAPPILGTLSFAPNGAFVYNRPAGPGSNSFTLRAFDGQAYSNVATISFTRYYGTGNASPQAVNDSYITLENTPLDVTTPQPPGFLGRGVLANDYDLDNSSAPARLAMGPAHQQAFTFNADGTFNYVPAPNFYGVDRFTYTDDDGAYHPYDATTGTVTITVARSNQPPIANDDTYTVSNGLSLNVQAPGVLTNDGDVEGDSLAAILDTPPQHGTLSLNSDGSFTYVASPGFSDPETFTYRPNDGKAPGNLATVTLRLAAVKAAPVAVNDSYSVDQYAQLVVDSTGGLGKAVLANDTDAAGVTASAQLITAPFHGALTLNSDGSFTYVPTIAFFGADSFVYQVRDNGTENIVSNFATVSIAVRHINTPPTANDRFFVAYGCTTPYIVPAPGVLSSASDIDGDPLTAVLVPGAGSDLISLNPDGGFATFGFFQFSYYITDGHSNSNVATVRWSYPPGSHCDPVLTPVAVNDSFAGGATIAVAAPGVLENDQNLGSNTLRAVLFSQPTHGTVTLGADGGFIYQATQGYSGSDSFKYYAQAGGEGSYLATVALTTTAGNHAPLAINRSDKTTINTQLSVAAPGVLQGATDLDGDKLSAVLASGPSHGRLDLNSDGSFVYTPAADYVGPDSFTFNANDGQANSPGPATVTISVSPVNQAPSGTDKNITLLVDSVIYTFGPGDFGFRDPLDAPANKLLGVKIVATPAAGIFIDGTAVVIAGQVIPAADIADGKLRFTPTVGASGSLYAQITFEVEDDGGTTSGGVDTDPTPKAISISIAPVNQPPSGANNTVVVQQAAGYVFGQGDFGFSDNYQFPGNHFVGVKITTLPTAGSLTDGGKDVVAGQFIVVTDMQSRRLVFAPASTVTASPYGSFTFQVKDDGGTASGSSDLDSTPRTMTINVAVVNHAPLGSGSEISIAENTSYWFSSYDFGFFDYDSPANKLAGVKITTLPQKGTLSLFGTPVAPGDLVSAANLSGLRYTPALYGSGWYYSSFAFQVKDDGGTANGGADLDPNPKEIVFDVLHVNQPPQGADHTVITSTNTSYVFSVADFGFSDPHDAFPLSLTGPNNLKAVRITTLPSRGSLINGTTPVTFGQFVAANDIRSGLLHFAPGANDSGSPYASFTFNVQDDGGTAVVYGSGGYGYGFGIDLDLTSRTMTVNVGAAINHAPQGSNTSKAIYNDAAYPLKLSDFGFSDPNDIPPNNFKGVLIAIPPPLGTLMDGGVTVSPGQFISTNDIASGQLVFTPGPGVGAGPDPFPYTSFTFQVQDDGGTANGGNDMDPVARTLRFDLFDGPSAPMGADNSVTTLEDQDYAFTAADFKFSDPNDFFPNDFVAVKIAALPKQGTLTNDAKAVMEGDFVPINDVKLGRLQFSPAAKSNGSAYASFTFQVQDNGGTTNGASDLDPIPRTMTASVTPVNDPPSFAKGDDQQATDEDPKTHGPAPQTVAPGWATKMLPGPATATDEVGQKLHFNVSLSQADSLLFTATGQPAIDPTSGDLTFRVAPNANGTAHVSVVLKDDGGTANGGIDASAAQMFDIVITKQFIWHNTKDPFDIDGRMCPPEVICPVTPPFEVLDIINYINAFGTYLDGHVPPLGSTIPGTVFVVGIGKPFGYIDVNCDDFVTAADALAVINAINASQAGAEGEPSQDDSDLMTLLAIDVAVQGKRKS